MLVNGVDAGEQCGEQRALGDELADLKERETSMYICHLSSAAAAKVGKVL